MYAGRPVTLDEGTTYVSASTGVAFLTLILEMPSELLNLTDIAMYRVAGRGATHTARLVDNVR